MKGIDMHDEKLELKLISQLMDQLQDEMEYDEDDFMSRLGKKKPDLEVVKIGGSIPEKMEEMVGKDLDGDMEEGEDPVHASMVLDEGAELSPEDKLKKRLMKLRG